MYDNIGGAGGQACGRTGVAGFPFHNFMRMCRLFRLCGTPYISMYFILTVEESSYVCRRRLDPEDPRPSSFGTVALVV